MHSSVISRCIYWVRLAGRCAACPHAGRPAAQLDCAPRLPNRHHTCRPFPPTPVCMPVPSPCPNPLAQRCFWYRARFTHAAAAVAPARRTPWYATAAARGGAPCTRHLSRRAAARHCRRTQPPPLPAQLRPAAANYALYSNCELPSQALIATGRKSGSRGPAAGRLPSCSRAPQCRASAGVWGVQ